MWTPCGGHAARPERPVITHPDHATETPSFHSGADSWTANPEVRMTVSPAKRRASGVAALSRAAPRLET